MNRNHTPCNLHAVAEALRVNQKLKRPVVTVRLEAALGGGRGIQNINWNGGWIEISCLECGVKFEVTQSRVKTKKFCSKDCKNSHFSKTFIPHNKGKKYGKGETIIQKACKFCGATFEIFLRMRNDYSTCSKECRSKWRAGIRGEKIWNFNNGGKKFKCQCAHCGKIFTRKRETVCCSLRCRGKFSRGKRLGPKAPHWKGGTTAKAKLFRQSVEYAEWRTAVFKRDDFTCQMCMKRGTTLNAHHIKKFSTHPDLRLFIPNGITLCEGCHEKTKWREHEFEREMQSKVTTLF